MENKIEMLEEEITILKKDILSLQALCHSVFHTIFVNEQEKYINGIKKTPYKCPICDGKVIFKLENHTDFNHFPCKACDKGVVWG